MMAEKVKQAPIRSMYQVAKLILGKARSRAPIIIGSKKFPNVVGIDGTRKKNTITMPWAVNSLLYVSDWNRSAAGVSSSSLISTAMVPPNRKKNVIVIR